MSPTLASSRYDALIVGSGAGGAPLAQRLSAAGMTVLVLEKGRWYRPADYEHDELLSVTRPDMFVPRVSDDPHVVVTHTGATSDRTLSNLGWIASCVGGGTAHMGGSFYRFHPTDFALRSAYGAFHEVVDWPYDYEALEPYYGIAEYAVGVSGDSAASASAGFRSRPYPMPPLDRHPLADTLIAAARRRGLAPTSTPRAINSVPYDGRPRCADCAFCSGYGCPVGARGSVDRTLLAAAEATGRCEIRPRAMVREITLDAGGRATGCIYIDDQGREHRVQARIVCVCCSAVESARLLLLSRSRRFPEGLANDSGLVGRHLQFRVGTTGRGRFAARTHPHDAVNDPRHFLGVSVHDYLTLPDSPSGWPRGGVMRFDMVRVHPVASAKRVARRGATAEGPLWGEPLRRALREQLCDSREVEFEVFQDFVPNDQTFVELDDVVTDRWGLPAARIHVAHPEHHGAVARLLRDRGLEILAEMGADELIPGDAGYINGVLVHGTCRAGTDRATSVLNPYCRAHAVPNLFVVDGSFMPASGAAPSTLTIMANSFRTADHIIDRASSHEL